LKQTKKNQSIKNKKMKMKTIHNFIHSSCAALPCLLSLLPPADLSLERDLHDRHPNRKSIF